jgi:hypothetical protein
MVDTVDAVVAIFSCAIFQSFRNHDIRSQYLLTLETTTSLSYICVRNSHES